MEDISKKIKTLEKELKILKKEKNKLYNRINIINPKKNTIESNLDKLNELKNITENYLNTKPEKCKKTYKQLLEPTLIDKVKNIDLTYLICYTNFQSIKSIENILLNIYNKINNVNNKLNKIYMENQYIFDIYKKNRDEIEFLDYESFSSDSD